ncbi:hypothetical protein K1T71_013425 [Dendrolimus kikuchii]|uniref:Uncharacterized protein n=1 Tax=Dendrolimus kikuchii TaxID=765133 RepID=A0ACC1CI29_9NEOP|nr:hypothetical protein K1T71_013425 [Dendrolimus kikuchii]
MCPCGASEPSCCGVETEQRPRRARSLRQRHRPTPSSGGAALPTPGYMAMRVTCGGSRRWESGAAPFPGGVRLRLRLPAVTCPHPDPPGTPRHLAQYSPLRLHHSGTITVLKRVMVHGTRGDTRARTAIQFRLAAMPVLARLRGGEARRRPGAPLPLRART